MEWVYLTLLILLSITGFYAGWRYVGQIKSRWWIPIAVIALAVIIIYSLFSSYPALEYNLIPSGLWPFTNIISWIPFGLLFFGIAAGKARTRFLLLEMAIFSLMIFAYGIMRVNWIFMDNQVDPSKFYMTGENICIQSTDYTCGAASAVTLLKYWGISTTEREMADLTRTRYAFGVEMIPLTQAIAQKTREENLTVCLITSDWETLKSFNTPCIVNTKWSPLIDHVVVVMKATEDGVTVADPLTGIKYWSRDEFLSKWRGTGIFIK